MSRHPLSDELARAIRPGQAADHDEQGDPGGYIIAVAVIHGDGRRGPLDCDQFDTLDELVAGLSERLAGAEVGAAFDVTLEVTT